MSIVLMRRVKEGPSGFSDKVRHIHIGRIAESLETFKKLIAVMGEKETTIAQSVPGSRAASEPRPSQQTASSSSSRAHEAAPPSPPPSPPP